MDDQSVEIIYTQVRACQPDRALVRHKEVQSAATVVAQQAITCHT